MAKSEGNIKIRAYGRAELAQLYSPHLSERGALRLLNIWIRRHPTLERDLFETGFTFTQRSFTPRQVKLLFESIGEPL